MEEEANQIIYSNCYFQQQISIQHSSHLSPPHISQYLITREPQPQDVCEKLFPGVIFLPHSLTSASMVNSKHAGFHP